MQKIKKMYKEKEPRGEYVLVIEGGGADAKHNSSKFEGVAPEDVVDSFIKQGMSKNEAIKAAAKELGLSRNELYSMMLNK